MKLTRTLAVLLTIYATSCSSPQDSTTEAPPSEQEDSSTEEIAAVSPLMEQGEAVYNQYCLTCHQADGAGVPGAFPPLSQTEWTVGESSKLVTVILNGLQGPIEVKGEPYNAAMAAHDFLSDEEVAAVATYVRQSFGNDASAVTAEEVAEVRATAK